MFPDVQTAGTWHAHAPHIDISKILAALDSLNLPTIESLLPTATSGSTKPGQAASDTRRKKYGQQLLGAACGVGAAVDLTGYRDVA
jgi:hypothetical protein